MGQETPSKAGSRDWGSVNTGDLARITGGHTGPTTPPRMVH